VLLFVLDSKGDRRRGGGPNLSERAALDIVDDEETVENPESSSSRDNSARGFQGGSVPRARRSSSPKLKPRARTFLRSA